MTRRRLFLLGAVVLLIVASGGAARGLAARAEPRAGAAVRAFRR